MKTFVLFALVSALAASDVRADGYEEHDYILNCSGCHRLDGSGSRTVPSLLAMAPLKNKRGSRSYFVRVPGVAQAPLSDARLAALLNWMMVRFTGETPKPPYTKEEVTRLRRSPLRDPFGERARLLTRSD